MDDIEQNTTGTSIDNTVTPASGIASPQSWEKAYKQHYENFVTLVSPRWAIQDFLIRMVCGLCGQTASVPRSRLGYRVNFAEMQRMYMRALQIDLIKLGVEMRFDETSQKAEGWGDMPVGLKKMDAILKAYIQAVRDYEYMTDATQKQYDMFIASSERDQDHVHLRAAILRAQKGVDDFEDSEQKYALPTGPWEVVRAGEKPVPIGGTRNASVQSLLRRALLTRVFLALL
ncbi:uncharacterized protein F4807DRAFT_343313 [Annulohypoxylon truncatum]|uniref:uncharacterized protein n=1 Tax=Annulohypoxylon truncatum TaxID=327061 RepID=UPI0020080834|nr:uncharacterized protein F4807DRAFT_343313 [Annulohypoxylon truncatum]KAI1212628.1 hypothetical protein F4807DRAFT_343313 [Annulohypoxylon truncatum]